MKKLEESRDYVKKQRTVAVMVQTGIERTKRLRVVAFRSVSTVTERTSVVNVLGCSVVVNSEVLYVILERIQTATSIS